MNSTLTFAAGRPLILASALLTLWMIPFRATAQSSQPPSEPPEEWGAISATLQEIPYPYPVHYLELHLHGQDVRLAYMDVAPRGEPLGRSVMIFHGMNFTGPGYAGTIDALADAGFRVIVPDRIGFGRSTAVVIPDNLNQKAHDAMSLLDHLGVSQTAVLGHSYGGMLATRFGLLYPSVATHLVIVNQIGLTDQRLSRPWTDTEVVYRAQLGTTYQDIARLHASYYPVWQPQYLEGVRIQYGQTLSGDWPTLARIRAGQQQIVYSDPVVYDWPHIRTKTLVIGGEMDGRTAAYDRLARQSAETFPNAELVLFPGVGHNPHLEIPGRFHTEVVRFLATDPTAPADRSWR